LERARALAILLACIAFLLAAVQPAGAAGETNANHVTGPMTRERLFQPSVFIQAKVGNRDVAVTATADGSSGWLITGRIEGPSTTVRFVPEQGDWDFSKHSLFSIAMRNDGPGTVWVEARLENAGAEDWKSSAASQSYLLPGEEGVVTVFYPREWSLDDDHAFSADSAAKPNGWRSHWKNFNARNVKGCRVVIRSSQPDIKLASVRPYLAWPYGKGANSAQVRYPYLDRFGQPLPFEWPTKAHSEEDLKNQRAAEQVQLARTRAPAVFNRFGGWENGPKLQATGFFRVQKHEGKWWIVDPDGRLFWSNGACNVDWYAPTPLTKERKPLFAWLPEKGSDAWKLGYDPKKYTYDFLALNTARKYGEDWLAEIRDTTHRRLRAWGINTLGSWSDRGLFDEHRTPYTEILHIWHGSHDLKTAPDTYEPGFEQRVRDAVQTLAKTRKQDPWMLGVFIDNEVKWSNDMIEMILANGTKQPAYGKFVEALKSKYKTLDALNKAWGTATADWDRLAPGKTDAWKGDRDTLYREFANRYYHACKQAMVELMPHHLYLGSRVHTCPMLVSEVAAKHVDVFSLNLYSPLANTSLVPKDADIPVMVSEFHFGTISRGILGASLSPVHDKTQAARNYAAYVTAGLIDPRIVGAHWFAYADQPAFGRPHENYGIGMIDIADFPYEEFNAMTRAVGERMYTIRSNKDAKLLDEVGALIRAANK
jgi:Beta-galactosidase